MFNFIKNKLTKIYSQFTDKLSGLFAKNRIDLETLKELEKILISADTGIKTTRIILENLQKQVKDGTIEKGADLKAALEAELSNMLKAYLPPHNCAVFLLVGINGSGKTTFAAKLAHRYIKEGKKVLLIAGDTFRAAATQQLKSWAVKIGASIEIGKKDQDPASVIYTGCERYKNEGFDVLIIDTAGRLQTKINLMKELEKLKRTINKVLPDKKVCSLLTIDSMLGQNSFEQAKLFNEATGLDGIILTKMDGTGKGGIVFSITQELKIPVVYISFGEEVEQFKEFDALEYVRELLS